MEYLPVGATGLVASKVVLGTLDFGGFISKEEAFRIIDRALELGINFIDTANSYGVRSGQFGLSETILGKWLAAHPDLRRKIILNTKCYQKLGDDRYGINDCDSLSYSKMILQLEDSLERLQTSYVDILTVHFEPTGTEFITPMWDAFETLKQKGLVYYAGASNFSVYGLMKAQEEARGRHISGFATAQNQYNLCRRTVELEMVPALKNEKIAQLCWSPLYGGRLTSKVFDPKSTGRKPTHPMSEELVRKLKEFQCLCDEYGFAEEQVALSWLFHRPVPCFVIIGPNSVKELEDCVRSSELVLPEEFNDRLESIFEGFSPAPEEYVNVRRRDFI